MSPKIAEFHRLHQSGCFVMPNPWDRGSAIYLQKLGFKALATTSAGFAWSVGKADNAVTVDQVLGHLKKIATTVSLPVNADFEGGYARDPQGVAANVERAVSTGVAGLSIEDSTGDKNAPLFDFGLAVERIQAARAAIDKTRSGVVLTGRSEGFFVGKPDIKDTIKRLEAYAAAGADCLYAPGIRTKEDISAVVKAVAPKPVNLLVHGNWITVAQAAELGVRRISIGGALARKTWNALTTAAQEIAEKGTFDNMVWTGAPVDLNGLFR
ncbi:MAG TPA: isocitrate lyase/phosphoenolpyruvate mutase family protein [Burkholderiales bacterium]|nr:isocitrate lyase/phosphoenolpyruvate mutase family protein [Burkholderiales bacterium]